MDTQNMLLYFRKDNYPLMMCQAAFIANTTLGHVLSFNTLRPWQNGRLFAADIFKCIFLKMIEFRFHWSHWQESGIGSGNGLAPNTPLPEPMMSRLQWFILITNQKSHRSVYEYITINTHIISGTISRDSVTSSTMCFAILVREIHRWSMDPPTKGGKLFQVMASSYHPTMNL